MHREVPDGMEALEILKTERFDLLFMDARMPGIDGLKATQFIRQEMKILESEMPVICISAASVNEDWVKYRNSGMNAFLPKPFSEETLLTTILSVIQDNESVPDDQPIINTGTVTGSSDKVDLKNLYHISGGDEQFVKQMLISFIDSTRNGLIEMQEAVNSGKFEPVAELAHKMMPPCRHLGVSDLAILLKKIEESVHNNAESQTLIQQTWEAINEFDTICVLITEQIAKIK